jgi:hypothetical protein
MSIYTALKKGLRNTAEEIVYIRNIFGSEKEKLLPTLENEYGSSYRGT